MTVRAMLGVVGLLTAGGVVAQETPTQPATSKNISYATYEERVDRVTVIVGSQAAGLAGHEKYIPLQVAVGVNGKGPELQITPARFVLIDAQGGILNAAEAREVAKASAILQFGKGFEAQNPLNTGQTFTHSVRVGSDFYPLNAGNFYTTTNLDDGTYLKDLVYFPIPPAGLDGLLTLQLLVPGMEHPVEAKFQIPTKTQKLKYEKPPKDTKQKKSS